MLLCDAVVQPPWEQLGRWIDGLILTPGEMEAKADELETVCRVLEENSDYPIDHVMQSGGIPSDTAVRGHIDVTLAVFMKSFTLAMVRPSHSSVLLHQRLQLEVGGRACPNLCVPFHWQCQSALHITVYLSS